MRGSAGDVRAGGSGRCAAMNGSMLLFAGVVIVCLAAIAIVDARTKLVPVRWLLGLVVAGLGWLELGGGRDVVGAGLWMHVLGAMVGVGVPAAMIAVAQAMGRRWPIFPGDALLLGAVGMILGLKAFLWGLSLGCLLAIVHRVCLQMRRGRPLFAGYLAAGPGLAAGAVVMFVALHAQFALAENVSPRADGDRGAILATELSPVKNRLPSELAERAVSLELEGPLAFGDLVAAIGEAAEVAVVIEERPSRLAEGGVELRDPGPVAVMSDRTLGLMLDEVASNAGYAWEWKDERVVFYRYWDESWPGAEVAEVEEPEKRKGAAGGVLGWFARLLGLGQTEKEAAGVVEPQESAAASEAVAEVPGESDSREPGAGEEPGDRVEEPGQWALPLTLPPAPEDLTVWVVDPDRQRTVRGVVEAWAERAEWKLAWRARQDFSVAAEASFEGEFLEAVDGLLSDPRLARVLAVSAHANRYLVVRDAVR